jgi:hypothetical protein
MRSKIKKIIPAINPHAVKVRLDHKTIITISRIESLKTWLDRFPEAKVLTH